MQALGVNGRGRYNTRIHPMAQVQKPRREVLEKFVAEKPGDAFARYGLALECVKLGDDEAATQHFRKLLETHPEYVAGYFQFGQFLSRLGQIEEARKLLSDGILVAQRAGDMHARDEMQAALTLLR
ncbi:MAG TPA: tetratricopeptide repeat protein [Verrucomicrobiae bacterium]|jgi:tetratricopeptide (TPR) repeat protein|nr:tetratricopeptide repeat protein [Verrucomicrobiae bacterium]